MADPRARERLLNALFTVGDTLADITINVEGTTFKAHKLILHCNSPVFAAMCGLNFREGQPDVNHIDLPEDDPEVIRAMLSYFYRQSYSPSTPVHPIAFHLKMFAVGDKYQDFELSNWAYAKAKEHFDRLDGHLPSWNDFCQIFDTYKELTGVPHIDTFEDTLVKLLAKGSHDTSLGWCKKPEMQDLLARHIKLTCLAMEYLARGPADPNFITQEQREIVRHEMRLEEVRRNIRQRSRPS